MTTLLQAAQSDAYDMIDRYLRNNMDDVDYESYSKALDVLAEGCAIAAAEKAEPIGHLDGTDKLADFMSIELRKDHEASGSSTPNAFTVPVYAHPVQAEPLTCAWTPMDDEHMPGTWASSCGELWSFIDGGPKENRVTYCHHCGGRVVIEAEVRG